MGVEKLDLKKEHGVLPKKTFEISVNVWDEESLLTLLSDLTQILGRTQRTTANRGRSDMSGLKIPASKKDKAGTK